MNTQQSIGQQHASNFSIPFFNSLICRTEGDAYWIGFSEQEINSFYSCGFKLLIASSLCNYPLAASVDILTRLAYSDESMKNLGQCGEITLTWFSEDAKPRTAIFNLLPEGTKFSHVQMVIHDDLAYVVLPCFIDWEVGSTDQHWLREKITRGVLEGLIP